jgi:putative toxin-antitoxin system antitoxin component (TIGR02293 family)
MSSHTSPLPELLGFAEVQTPFAEPQAARIEASIRAGLPKTALFNVARLIAEDSAEANEIAYTVVPKSSLARRATLTPEQGEKTERLARLYLQAEATLGGPQDARAFLRAAHPELGDRTPLQAAETELGGRAVERILAAVEFGLPV